MTDTPTAMSCPVCRIPLVMSERQGVEIDYCPQCRGVWLDRGELDKILERSAQDLAPPPPPRAAPAPHQSPPGRSEYDRDHGYGYGHGGYKKKRRKSFLEELFD